MPLRLIRAFPQSWTKSLRSLSAHEPGRATRRRARLGVEYLEGRVVPAAPLVSEVTSGTSNTRIAGVVYDDMNGNGVFDDGDEKLGGWTVYLDLDQSGARNVDAVGAMEPSAVTDNDGRFSIRNLVPGTYRVAEVVSPGWTPTSPVFLDAAVVAGNTTQATFLNYSGGDIVGTLWNDLDADGDRAADPVTHEFLEPGLEGWTVFLDANNDGIVDPGEPATLTDANGRYSFVNLPPGDYEVTELLPAGWELAPGFDDTRTTVNVVAQQESICDYGNFSLSSGAIRGTIFDDANIDGIRNVINPETGAFSEPGLAGWTVFLDLSNDGLPDIDEPTTTTDADGAYSFLGVLAGDYEVTEIVPDGWYVSPGYDLRQTVTVNPGETTIAGDFANFTALNGSIRGIVWNDLNRDGVRDAAPDGTLTDPGLAGWTVFLDRNRNGVADPGEPTATTDADGVYLFADLQVGDYEVREMLPAGWEVTPTYSDSVPVAVFSGTESIAPDFANFNIGAATAGSIAGSVWNDLDGNGARDAGDLGISGWTVFIDVDGNGALDGGEPSATSGGDGSYTIAGVTPGTVSVREVVPAGWTPTSPASGSFVVALRNAENLGGVDFGNYARQDGVISGVVFADRDKNGLRGAGESGLSSITVYLDINNNATLDAGEPRTATSVDQFYTPTVDEAGTYSFTHLAAGTYTVRYVLPATLDATPTSERSDVVTLATAEQRSGVDCAAVYRANEIHGIKFDDANGNRARDDGESGVVGARLYIDLDRDNVRDADEPTTLSGSDGSYSFTGLEPGAYVVREDVPSGYEPTYPTTVGGILWPSGTSHPAVGNVTPKSITEWLAKGQTFSQTVSITLPGTGALTNLVDVFLLFDDTGSFVNNSPIVRAAFPFIIDQLQAALPGIDLGFGVGRFEEYGNFAWEYDSGRPFVLNQPIVAASTAGYMTAIQAALNRTTPGYGGDGPETDIEALYQLVTGRGFDGNNNGTVLDSGPAGPASTQLNPGPSGDVPSFASFVADAGNDVMAPAGTVGGGGFRAGALPIILTATDIGFAYQPKGETSIAGVGDVSLPLSALTETSRPSTPFNSGAGIQETVTALNSLGALVIGLGTNPEPTFDPRQGLEALSKLTGAINRSTTTIDNGTADPIAPGDPLYFQISSGFAASVAAGIVNAIQNAVTAVAVDITVQASDPRVKIVNGNVVRTGIGAGQTASFDIAFTGDGIPHRFDLQFVRNGTNVVLGSIPVVLGTPIPGDCYEFEDLAEGEIHNSVDFGSRALTVSAAPTVDGVSPFVGPTTGAYTVTITGTGFDGATQVRFGANAVAIPPNASATTIVVAVPSQTLAGPVDVYVTNAAGESAPTTFHLGVNQILYVDATLAIDGSSTSTVGQSVGFTLTIAGGDLPAATTFSLKDASNGNAVVGSITVSANASVGTASIASLSIGAHSIFAEYDGVAVASVAALHSNAVSHTVAPARLSTVAIDAGPAVAIGSNLAGQGQGSVVRTIAVVFDAPIDAAAAGAFAIADSSNQPIADLTVNVAGVGTNSLTLSFVDLDPNDNAGPVTFGSLADGRYRLTIDGSLLTAAGQAVDADGAGPGGAGSVGVHDFSRLFGDVNNNGFVDATDLYPYLVDSIDKPLGDPGYNPAFDFNGDGFIDAVDIYPYIVERIDRGIA